MIIPCILQVAEYSSRIFGESVSILCLRVGLLSSRRIIERNGSLNHDICWQCKQLLYLMEVILRLKYQIINRFLVIFFENTYHCSQFVLFINSKQFVSGNRDIKMDCFCLCRDGHKHYNC